MTKISFNKVNKSYLEDRKIINDFSIEFKSGELYFITGVTGCGKTTILKMIYMLELPTSGEISMNDKVLTLKKKFKKHRANIGFVFQDYQLLDDYSAMYNISLPLFISGFSNRKVNKRILELANELGIKDLLSQKVQTLSGGEKQLVSIARAISTNPSVLLVDEPSAHLDRKSSLKILNVLLNIQRKGVTILITTHDISLIKSVSNANLILIENNNFKFIKI